MESLRPIHVPSVHQAIQERVKQYILANSLQPGDALPSETQLAQKLNVSRGVVREALRSLESSGVIYSRRGAGRYVSRFNLDLVVSSLSYGMRFDTEDLQEIINVRERLEVSFIADAIAAMDEDTLRQLWALIDQMRQKAAAGEDFLEEDLEFHRTIYLVIGNHLLVKLLDVFQTVYHNLRDASLLVPPTGLGAKLRDHTGILEAIEAKDIELAQHRIVDHFDGIKGRLRTARVRKTSAREVPSTKATEDTSR